MARAHSHVQAPASPEQTVSPTWADWFSGFQLFQVQAARDMLAMYNRYLAALGSSRDPQSIMSANQAAASDWQTCVDGIRDRWQQLATAVPADAMAATGWRLKPGVNPIAGSDVHDSRPDLFEQSRLGVEMLLRPWMPAPDLDHTDEFVA